MQLFTIGFTQKSAEEFFTKLRAAGVRRIVDVRLHNNSQLAGFAKKDDPSYFLKEIGEIDYVHLPELAPTEAMFDAFKKKKGDWNVFERQFKALLAQRKIEKTLDRKLIDEGCFLCSEHLPHHCHRRLIAEYLEKKWGNIDTRHLT